MRLTGKEIENAIEEEEGRDKKFLNCFQFSYLNIRQQYCFVRFEVFTAVAMKNGVFWDVTPCGSCKNRHLGRT
jgi:hypothetical protein